MKPKYVGLLGVGIVVIVGVMVFFLMQGDDEEGSDEDDNIITTLYPNAGFETITANDDWTPVMQKFDGVEMVLVPVGCFMMGSADDQYDLAVRMYQAEYGEAGSSGIVFQNEQPGHQRCFDQPFWIDRYEVTTEQFERLGGVAAEPTAWPGDNVPRGNLSWREAKAYCELRGMRLPTEPEWEYAARGPSALIFPWGDEFEARNVVYTENAPRYRIPDSNFTLPGPARVASRRGGVSWVGAHDMSGNIYEWVDGSIYDDYPDGLKTFSEGMESWQPVMRGGSGGGVGGYDFRVRAADREGSFSATEYTGVRCAGGF